MSKYTKFTLYQHDRRLPRIMFKIKNVTLMSSGHVGTDHLIIPLPHSVVWATQPRRPSASCRFAPSGRATRRRRSILTTVPCASRATSPTMWFGSCPAGSHQQINFDFRLLSSSFPSPLCYS